MKFPKFDLKTHKELGKMVSLHTMATKNKLPDEVYELICEYSGNNSIYDTYLFR